MTSEKDVNRVIFNVSLAHTSLKAMQVLDRLLDPAASAQLPADIRRELRLAAATVLRVSERDVDEALTTEVTERFDAVRERLAQGQDLSDQAIRDSVANRPPRQPPSGPAEPQPRPEHPHTPATATSIPPLPGTLIAATPSPAAALRSRAGAGDTPGAASGARPLKQSRPPPPMMAA